MKLSFKKKRTFILMLIITVVLFISNCKKAETEGDSQDAKITSTTKAADVNINRINFYFENSLSMNGYLDGKDFKQTMHRIIDVNNQNLQTFFVNTKQYDASNILTKIDSKNIGTQGVNQSNHQFIFTNAINNTKNNNLSIVVTDGIYSTPAGDIDIVEVEIERAFKNSLQTNALETVVLKMSSDYNGTYYTESPKCGNVKINQKRPYYILLFGNKRVIDKALKDIVNVENLGGYQNQARFFLTKEMKVDYSVLLNGEEKKGSFKPEENSSPMKSIEETEKYTPNGKSLKDAYLQFAIAVDFSNISIPEEYLVEKVNYTIDPNTDYDIVEIKKIDNISKDTKDEVGRKLKNATHIIVVKGKSQLFGDLNIHLNIYTPSWIAETGSMDDCTILNDTTKTIAFDKLMKGISKAYEEINDKKEYLKLIIKINP